MKITETKWYRYVKENEHKYLVWFIFFFVSAILVFLTIEILSAISSGRSSMPPVEEVKIYFPKNESDTLLDVVNGKLIEIQEAIEEMRKDSISVSVQKLIK